MTTPLWSIVLAAGKGRRLSGITGGVPKQFYAPRGGRTLLEDTVHRLAPLAPSARMVTVVDRTHARYAAVVRQRVSLGRIASQPMDRGTAAGVLLGLTTLDMRADDIVAVTPSDHGVSDPEVFRHGIRKAVEGVRRGDAHIVLLAVAPSAPSADYGWILAAPPQGDSDGALQAVTAFVEKPSTERAGRLFAAGAVWNTMVLVGRAGALLGACRDHVPQLTAVFELAGRLPRASRERLLDARYPDLPIADFSKDVLTRAAGLGLYVWPDELGWTDLGTPERLAAWLREQPGPGRRAEDVAAADEPSLAASA